MQCPISQIHQPELNDVYRVTPEKTSPTSSDTIDVTQFASLLHGIRDQWSQRLDGKRDGKNPVLIRIGV